MSFLSAHIPTKGEAAISFAVSPLLLPGPRGAQRKFNSIAFLVRQTVQVDLAISIKHLLDANGLTGHQNPSLHGRTFVAAPEES